MKAPTALQYLRTAQRIHQKDGEVEIDIPVRPKEQEEARIFINALKAGVKHTPDWERDERNL